MVNRQEAINKVIVNDIDYVYEKFTDFGYDLAKELAKSAAQRGSQDILSVLYQHYKFDDFDMEIMMARALDNLHISLATMILKRTNVDIDCVEKHMKNKRAYMMFLKLIIKSMLHLWKEEK